LITFYFRLQKDLLYFVQLCLPWLFLTCLRFLIFFFFFFFFFLRSLFIRVFCPTVVYRLRWGKDEEIFSVVVRWLVQLLFNFTLGLVGALVVFVFKLWGLIQAYSPDPLTAFLYFSLAAASATACVATYLFVLYGAAAGSVAVVAKAIVDHNHRLQQDPNNRRRQNLQGGGMGGGGGGGPGGGGDPRMDPRYRAYMQQQQQQQQQRQHHD
jgi:uncharacterized membrane protein YgcG